MKIEHIFASFALFFFSLTGTSLEGRPVIIGHRGASGHAPENTLASFAKALEFKVDAIELDVHLSKSGELIVIHDETLDRTTNGKGAISKKTLDELEQYTCEGNEKIPTLNEVFDLVQRRCIINVELKGALTGQPVADLIKKYVEEKGWTYEDFFVSSFNHHELFTFHELLPTVKTGALLEGIPFHYAAFAEDIGATHAVLHSQTVNKEFVEDAHKRGLLVFVYTVNDPLTMTLLQDMGVDGIITNYPDRCKDL